MNLHLTILAILLILCGTGFSDWDDDAFIDANRIGMYVGNNGLLANDFFYEMGQSFAGLYYDNDSINALVFASGLWVVGKTKGELRTALGYYMVNRRYTEFSPGPADSDSASSLRYRVYKISSDDLVNPGTDYLTWPEDLGAPLDEYGKPLLIGQQTLFSIYNDLDTARRTLIADSDSALGCEVRQLVWAYDKEKYLGDVVFVEFKIENVSGSTWDSVFVGLWADPDVGRPNNDLIGARQSPPMTYAFSSELDSELEQIGYPAVGFMILGARTSGQQTYKPYSATNIPGNLFFPSTKEQAYYKLRGLDPNGNPNIDPTTGQETYFPYGGDPRYQVGWLDDAPDDERTMISRGPYRIRAGETLTVTAAYLAVVSPDETESFNKLFALSEKVADWFDYRMDGIQVSSGSVAGQIRQANFEPDYQNWMAPVSFPNDFAGSGIGKASQILGSSLDDSLLSSVELQFSYDSTQNAYYYIYGDNGWTYSGYYPIPVRAYKKSNGQRLNLIFMSEQGDDCNHCFINSSRFNDIYRLIVLNSAYSPVENSKYVLENPLAKFDDLDLMYLLQFALDPNALIYNIADGQTLDIIYSKVSAPDNFKSLQFFPRTVSTHESRGYFLTSEYNSPMHISANFRYEADFSSIQSEYALAGKSETPLYFNFQPYDPGSSQISLMLYNSDFEEYFEKVKFSGEGLAWPVEGDYNLNGWLEPADVVGYLGYLYRDKDLPVLEIDLDLDASGEIALPDVITLINILFFSR